MAPKVIGATGAPAIPFERITEITLCAEVLCEVIGHYRMYSLEESRHAPAGVRKAAWDARIITTSKMEVKMSTEEIVRPCADLAVAHPLNEFIKASNEVGKVYLEHLHSQCHCPHLLYTLISLLTACLHNPTLVSVALDSMSL